MRNERNARRWWTLQVGVVAALWLAYLAIPLIAGLHPDDPFACCRAKGAHGCFLHLHHDGDAPVLATPMRFCSDAMQRGLPTSPCVRAVATPRFDRIADLAVDPQSSDSRVAATTNPIRSPRAPPQVSATPSSPKSATNSKECTQWRRDFFVSL